jgi:2-keto-3-deoxy-L-rhamnonate aldolase RhmA
MGNRSVGIARAQGYGASFGAYVSQANENVAVIIQVEPYIQQGYTLIAVGMDTLMLDQSARPVLADLSP